MLRRTFIGCDLTCAVRCGALSLSDDGNTQQMSQQGADRLPSRFSTHESLGSGATRDTVYGVHVRSQSDPVTTVLVYHGLILAIFFSTFAHPL